jgi:hypothetical protein
MLKTLRQIRADRTREDATRKERRIAHSLPSFNDVARPRVAGVRTWMPKHCSINASVKYKANRSNRP